MANAEEYRISGYMKATSRAIKYVLECIERDPTKCEVFITVLKNVSFQDLATHLEIALKSPNTQSFQQNKSGKYLWNLANWQAINHEAISCLVGQLIS